MDIEVTDCKKQKMTKVDAVTLLNFINKRKVNRNRKAGKYRKEIRYYQCPYCNYWHLTSKVEFDGGKVMDVPDLKKIEIWQKLLNGETTKS